MAKPKNLEQLRAEKEQVETQLAQEQHMPYLFVKSSVALNLS